MAANWAFFVLVTVSIAALAASVGGANYGWAYVSKSLAESKQLGPAIQIEVLIGWWRSQTHITSGWIPGGFEISGDSTKWVGLATAIAASLAILYALYHLAFSAADAMGWRIPPVWRLHHTYSYTMTQIASALPLVMSLVLYITLLITVHQQAKEKFGDDVSVWARPDWAFACALLGSISLLGAAQQLAPTGYEAALEGGYAPI